MDPTTTGSSSNGSSTYTKKSGSSDEALNSTTELREIAPGGLNALHVGIVLDRTAAANTNPQQIQNMIASAIGINKKRGDTLNTAVLPFDRSAEAAAAKELKAQAAAEKKNQTMTYVKDTAPVVLLLLALLIAWLRGRKRAKARAEATSYVVEQLREEAAARAALVGAERTPVSAASQLLSLEGGAERSEDDEMRDELAALVESQPEDVAGLLRGWLVERQP